MEMTEGKTNYSVERKYVNIKIKSGVNVNMNLRHNQKENRQ